MNLYQEMMKHAGKMLFTCPFSLLPEIPGSRASNGERVPTNPLTFCDPISYLCTWWGPLNPVSLPDSFDSSQIPGSRATL